MAKRARKLVKPKFDWDGFKLLGGMGIAMSAFGVFMFWVAYTAPEGSSNRLALTTTQHIVSLIPNETQLKIVFVMSVIFILFGIFLILTAIYRSLKFLFTRNN